MKPLGTSPQKPANRKHGEASVRVVTCSASSIPGINNFGDELLTEIYHRWIREYDPRIQPIHLRINPLAPFSSENRDLIAGAACLLFTGGGYFADGYSSRLAIKGQLRSLRNRNIYWRAFEHAERNGVPCAVLGLEVGPVTNPSYRRAVERILSAARFVTVRNHESVANTRELTSGAVEPTMCLDAAFSLATGAPAPAKASDSNTVDVALHMHTFAGTEGWDQLVRAIQKEIGGSRSMRLTFLYDQRKRDQRPSAWVEVEKAVLSEFPDANVVRYRTTNETMVELRRMDLVVTSKLHAGIVSRALGIPALMLGEHAKIRRCFATIGEEHLCGAPLELARSLPADVVRALDGSGPSRIPCPEEAVQSALGNREILRQMLSMVTTGQ